MQFETALNLVWLMLGMVALASTARTHLEQRAGKRRAPAFLHIVGVALIVAALFPYISATDDALRAEHFSAEQHHKHSGTPTRTDNLMRLYEVMDSPVLCESCEIALTFFFVSFVLTPEVHSMNRNVPLQAGRSPPLFLPA